MQAIATRRALIGDAEAIASLMTQLGYEASLKEIDARLRRLLRRDDYIIAVAEVGQRLVGWVAGEHRELLEFDPRVEIVGLVVTTEYRRHGIGSALVAEIEAWQAERGIKTIFVRSNVARSESHPFYESIGYTRHKTQHAYIKHNAD